MGSGGVRLVAPKREGGAAGPARAGSRDPELTQKHWQGWGVTGLSGGEDQNKRQPAPVDQGVGLCCQATPGTANRVVTRFVLFVPATSRNLVVR